MHAPHIVLIDTRGTIVDYAVSTDVLAQVFTLLQSTGERQDHPLLKSEYLEIGKREPKPEPKPEIIDDIPSFLPPQDKPKPEPKPEITDDIPSFMASLSSLFEST